MKSKINFFFYVYTCVLKMEKIDKSRIFVEINGNVFNMMNNIFKGKNRNY